MNSLTRLGFLLSIAGGLLAVAPPMADAYIFVKLLCLAAGGALIWAGLFTKPLARTALDRPMAALWAALTVSAAFSVDRAASVLGMYPQTFYGLVPLALCAQLFYAAAAAGGDEKSGDKLVRWMLAASIPLSLYGVSQRLFGDLLTGFPLFGNRITSTIGSPIMFGSVLVLLIPLALDEALRRRSRTAAAALGLMLVALVMTWSRGAWLSAGAAAAGYLWLTGRLRLRRRQALALSALALLLMLAASRALVKGDSDSQRLETAKTAVTAFEAHPLLGYGPDTFVLAFRRFKTDQFVRVTHGTFTESLSAHNDILQVAATLGLAGLLAYGWLLWALGARLASRLSGPTPDGREAAIAAALFGAFLQAKVNPAPPTALALAAILAGLACRERSAPPRAAGRAAASLAAVLCAGGVFLYARFCSADVKYRTGTLVTGSRPLADPGFMAGVNDLRRATELNPWVMEYLSKRCDVIFRVAPFTPPEQGRELMHKAIQLAAEGVQRHPENASSHALLATALALATRYGGKMLPEASSEIRKATELDPTLTFLLRRRMDIDRATGDQEDFERTRQAYLRVIALSGETANFSPLIF